MMTLQNLMAKGTVLPKPEHLTVDKIVNAMSIIKPGDLIHFDSYKGCEEAIDVTRIIPIQTIGEVIEKAIDEGTGLKYLIWISNGEIVKRSNRVS